MQSQQQNNFNLLLLDSLSNIAPPPQKKSGGDFGVFAQNQKNSTVIYTLQSQVAR